MTTLTTLDILYIVSSIVIGGVGVYLMLILHRVFHMSRVADRFAKAIEKFQDIFAIIDTIPTDIIKKVTARMNHKK